MNAATIRIEARSDRERARRALDGPLGFGKVFADLMVRIPHTPEEGWHDPAVVPFGPLPLSPAAKVLHYSQEVFEGHKVYRQVSGEIALFRPELNARRFAASATRLRMPALPEELHLEAMETLADLLRDWVPFEPGSSLYLRPTLIGVDEELGVGPSRRHLYFLIASPVGAYFPRGFSPVSILVEEEQVRAAPGGVGWVKTGGNYVAGLDGQERAREAGYDQILWLDALEHRYLEELNAMNIFLVKEGRLVTPPLGGTILPGITRRSLLEMAPDLGLQAEERPVAIESLLEGLASGRVSEIFAAGTAAVVTPVGALGFRGERILVGEGEPGPVARRLYEAVTAIQYGRGPDEREWMRLVPRRSADALTAPEEASWEPVEARPC